MRQFNEAEIEAYNKVRERQLAEANRLSKLLEDRRLTGAEAVEIRNQLNNLEILPEHNNSFVVEYADSGITTHSRILLNDANLLEGWAVYSPIDQHKPRTIRPPQVREIGRSVAFSRALHFPLVWTD